MKYPLVLKSYNLYHLLGLENFASGEQIKKRYWQLAKKFHPDRFDSTEEENQFFVLSTAAYNFLRDVNRRRSYEQLLKRKEEVKIGYKSSELVCQRQKTHKRFYSARMTVDHDFNRFVDECRVNFAKFLKHGKKIKVRPKIISKGNTEEAEFEGYVEEGLIGFQDFIKSVPRIKTRRF
ncbi:MAG: DnaJ domain-containing protein [Nitrospina sp.]|jgi:DnaJ-class molecular chaperone|nr:DnaJ domain-containing protein [Nitrospina sp.]MBT5632474.1 DnaJ domain-containing protein [Nitrospina sp.]